MKPNEADRIQANKLWFDIGSDQDEAIIERIAVEFAKARRRQAATQLGSTEIKRLEARCDELHSLKEQWRKKYEDLDAYIASCLL